MAKTVFGSHDQTAHVWAQGRGGDTGNGRSSDGRMFFEGRTLYSYGRHFVLGIVVLGADGHPVATLLNSSRYSPSTGKHQSHTWRAARGERIHVPNLTGIASTLSGLGKVAPSKGDKDLGRINLARHFREHFADYEASAAAFVYGLAGGTPKQAAAIIDKAKRQAEAKAKASAKAQLSLLIRNAKEIARLKPEAFRAFVRGEIGTSEYDASHRFEQLIKRLRKLHKTASSQGLDKVKTALWAHLKGLAEFGDNARLTAKIANRAKAARAAIKTLRGYWANLAAEEPKALTANQWSMVEAAARELEKIVFKRAHGSNLDSVLHLLAAHATDQYQAARIAENEAREAERAARIEASRKAAEEAKAAWFAGDPAAQWRGSTEGGGAFIRAVHVERDESGAIIGGDLQTSQGAHVPLTHALKAFRFLKLCRTNGREWNANGKTVPVGHFRIEKIKANGDFVAGCHFIEWEQVAALAASLGVEGWQGDESAVVETAHA